jgi:hypothetical protein
MDNPHEAESAAWEKQKNYVDKIAAIPDNVRDGIIEKWLTYTKSENLTEF